MRNIMKSRYCEIQNLAGTDETEIRYLMQYYEDNLLKVTNILGEKLSVIPKDTKVKIITGSKGSYSCEDRCIKYGIENSPDNRGVLIHEITHVVQSYPEGIGHEHPYYWLMEGIADYCREQLDDNFNVAQGDPKHGYSETAHFLIFLVKKYGPKTLHAINQGIKKNTRLDCRGGEILIEDITNCSFRELLYKYWGK